MAVKRLWKSVFKYNISAIITISDIVAVGIYKASKELGIRIPKDISIIGNDDIPLARYLEPSLTTIRQPKFKLGYKSTEFLLDYIVNGTYNKNDVKTFIFETKLIIRNSTLKK